MRQVVHTTEIVVPHCWLENLLALQNKYRHYSIQKTWIFFAKGWHPRRPRLPLAFRQSRSNRKCQRTGCGTNWSPRQCANEITSRTRVVPKDPTPVLLTAHAYRFCTGVISCRCGEVHENTYPKPVRKEWARRRCAEGLVGMPVRGGRYTEERDRCRHLRDGASVLKLIVLR